MRQIRILFDEKHEAYDFYNRLKPRATARIYQEEKYWAVEFSAKRIVPVYDDKED